MQPELLALMSMVFIKHLTLAASLFIALIAFQQFSNQGAYATVIEVLCPTYTFDLEPFTDENFTDEEHTVTATLTEEGVSVEGRAVGFEVVGVNPTGGGAFTDASGQATFTYTGTNAGLDTITATTTIECFDFSGQLQLVRIFDTATKNWTIFVIPESPIGIIALVGSSLAALGGFMFWKRKHGNSQPRSLGDFGI